MVSKFRVLFTTSAPGIWGAQTNLIGLINTINPKKFAVYVLANPASCFGDYISISPKQILYLNTPQYSMHDFKNLVFFSLKLAKFLIKNNIDLIYINSFMDFKVIYPLSKLLNIPIIVHLHIYVDDSGLKWLRINSANKILFPSNYLKDLSLKKSPWIDSRKCFVVPNAVDTDYYRPINTVGLCKSLALNENFPIIGMFGQIKEIKGQDLFFKMVAELVKYGIKAQYLIVGDDPSESKAYFKRLQGLGKKLCIDEKVKFLGFRKDVPELMSLCDLIIVPSRREPFGRVVIESMACGTPIVAAKTGGICEIFNDGYGGLFFSSDDVKDLVDKVIYFFQNPLFWKRQKELAVRLARSTFRQELHTKAIEDHILEAIGIKNE